MKIDLEDYYSLGQALFISKSGNKQGIIGRLSHYDILFEKIIKFGGHGEDQTGYDNCHEVLLIYQYNYLGKTVFGYFHHFPAGYSSYTYEPEEINNIFLDYDWDSFVMFGLTENLRYHIKNMQPRTLKLLYGGNK